MQIGYDPKLIKLETLLELFWSLHDPTRGGRSQYRAEVFCEQDDCEVIRRSADHVGPALATRITQGKPFFSAEAYHQKWKLRRHRPLWDELVACYPDERTALSSVAAAKLNGHLGGHGSESSLGRDGARMGLSPSGQAYLRNVVAQQRKPARDFSWLTASRGS